MSKKATDFYKDLNELAKKEKLSKKSGGTSPGLASGDLKSRLEKRPIPWGKLYILFSLISSVAYFKHREIMQSQFFIENVKPLPVVKEVVEKIEPIIERYSPPVNSNGSGQANTRTSASNPSGGGAYYDNGAGDAPTPDNSKQELGPDGKPKPRRMIQIRGKYYKESPNHIYIINGEKIYYKDGKP